MAEVIACLARGNLELLLPGRPAERLPPPHGKQLGAVDRSGQSRTLVGISRGRAKGELCYAVQADGATSVFAYNLATGQEQRLFRGVATAISEIDLSVADEALACTVAGPHGATWLGVLSDDGKGVRTVTEGDVVDRSPRWVPGGRAELVYASAGIGRTRSGAHAGLSPFALHRLRFAESSVEVMVSDAQYDYLSPVLVTESLLYALRRSYQKPTERSPWALISAWLSGTRSHRPQAPAAALTGSDLVRITPDGSEIVARDVLAFDVEGSTIAYSNPDAVFRAQNGGATGATVVHALAGVGQLVIAST